jgi:hypothetical protein
MELTATLLDSNLIKAQDYEAYLSKFLIEAKQALKKQLINEKSKAIEKAQKEDVELRNRSGYKQDDVDYGNNRLVLYAKLLLPFWEKNPQVPALFQQLLASNDKRLKYNTAHLLLRHRKPVADSLLQYFAAQDEYRYELYTDLQKMGKLSLFPVAYKNQLDLARSELLAENNYNKPDTLVFLEKLPLTFKDRSGYVYVFKYKENKQDNSWKLATAGLLPVADNEYHFPRKGNNTRAAYWYNFTDLTNTKLTADTPEKEQVQKQLKKMMYSKRRSGARFYTDMRDNDFE